MPYKTLSWPGPVPGEDRILAAVRPLVLSQARHLATVAPECIDDLRQEAMIGALYAIRRYQPSQGDMAAVACRSARTRGIDYLRAHRRTIHRGSTLVRLTHRVHREAVDPARVLRDEDYAGACAERLQVTRTLLADACREICLYQCDASLDAAVVTEGRLVRLGELIADPSRPDLPQLIDVQAAIDALPERLRRVFILCGAACTQDDVARRLGVSAATVNTLYQEALTALRAALGVECAPEVPGVRKRRRLWVVERRLHGQRHYLGSYVTLREAEDASRAFDREHGLETNDRSSPREAVDA